MLFNSIAQTQYEQVRMQNKNYIQDCLNRGMRLLDENFSNQQLDSWLYYTEQVLNTAFRNTTSNVYLNFLQLKLELHYQNIPLVYKLNAYLKYLIEVIKFI